MAIVSNPGVSINFSQIGSLGNKTSLLSRLKLLLITSTFLWEGVNLSKFPIFYSPRPLIITETTLFHWVILPDGWERKHLIWALISSQELQDLKYFTHHRVMWKELPLEISAYLKKVRSRKILSWEVWRFLESKLFLRRELGVLSQKKWYKNTIWEIKVILSCTE